MRARIALLLGLVQGIFGLLHYFLYRTLIDFVWRPAAPELARLQLAFVILAFCFPLASLLAFQANNVVLRAFYAVSAVWIGLASFWFWASLICALLAAAAVLTRLAIPLHNIALMLFALGAVAALGAMLNAAWPRVRRVSVPVANLPAAWRGRVIALVSDTHLGHVRYFGFNRRVVRILESLRPAAIFVAGDFYDGTRADLPRLAAAWRQLASSCGVYFSAGNHEEFGDHSRYLAALRAVGVRVLDNEKVVIDGLQIVGIHYRDTIDPRRYRDLLAKAAIYPDTASILLTHSPHHLNIAAQSNVSLALCGHTHGGQFVPYTWITKRIFGPFVHGLHRYERMWVFTTYGVGTWGPPLRLGTVPEIVLLQLELET